MNLRMNNPSAALRRLLVLWVVAAGVSLSGCCKVKVAPAFEYAMPVPYRTPVYGPCPRREDETCVTLLEDDFDIYLTDLALLCEIVGNDPRQCDIR